MCVVSLQLVYFIATAIVVIDMRLAIQRIIWIWLWAIGCTFVLFGVRQHRIRLFTGHLIISVISVLWSLGIAILAVICFTSPAGANTVNVLRTLLAYDDSVLLELSTVWSGNDIYGCCLGLKALIVCIECLSFVLVMKVLLWIRQQKKSEVVSGYGSIPKCILCDTDDDRHEAADDNAGADAE